MLHLHATRDEKNACQVHLVSPLNIDIKGRTVPKTYRVHVSIATVLANGSIPHEF